MITGNGSRAAGGDSVGMHAVPPDVSHCGAARAMPAQFASTFYHQHMRAQQCFRMVEEEEQRLGARYDFVVRNRPEFGPVGCICSSPPIFSTSHLYSIDLCHVRARAPLLCDGFWIVPRHYAQIVFNVVDGWADCHSYVSRFPCHDRTGLAPECLLTAWLVDHGIPRAAFGEGTELLELGLFG
jgi:hypothetical protein